MVVSLLCQKERSADGRTERHCGKSRPEGGTYLYIEQTVAYPLALLLFCGSTIKIPLLFLSGNLLTIYF